MTVTKDTELSPPSLPSGIIEHAAADDHRIDLWRHGRSVHTQRAYRADVDRFPQIRGRAAATRHPRRRAGVFRLTGWPGPASSTRTLAAVKSLLAFGQRTGCLPLNVCAAGKLPQYKDTLAERILTEADVHRPLTVEPDRRNQVLLRPLYYAELRVSEIVGLTWRDLQPSTDGGQVTVFGKGSKTRVVLLELSS